MNFNLQDRTIFLTISGSHSYGMATPTSDFDYRGICIPPFESYIGLKEKFEQIVDSNTKHTYKHFPIGLLKGDPRVKGNSEETTPDMQIMELSKFMRLALSNNPSVLEVLFTDNEDHVIKNPIINSILENRNKLLSKSVKARFCGYALSQLKRIKTHRKWLLNPVEEKPLRKDFGLPEFTLISQDQLNSADSLIQFEIDSFLIDQTHLPEDVKIELNQSMYNYMHFVWESLNSSANRDVNDEFFYGIAKNKGFDDNFIEVLIREKKYKSAKKEWNQYQEWKINRNPARAELEKRIGYDGKHAAHLVRLLRTCREILETGNLIVKRKDAEELLAIRNGLWKFDDLLDFANKEDIELEKVVKNSSLPKIPDSNFFDGLVRNIILEFNNA